MKSAVLYFAGPGRVEVREEALREPGPGQVLVCAELTGISAGTEMLVYRGQFPRDLADSNDQVSGNMHYPLRYGYASVGRVVKLGDAVDEAWRDRLVFAFQPHGSAYLASPDSLIPIPDGIPARSAVFLPNMETAVNLVQDAQPLLGEAVLVLGQGVVGLLTAGLLRRFPLQLLVTADRYELRRKASRDLGVPVAFDPTFNDFRQRALEALHSELKGFDLTLELSGNPSALDDAIALTTFTGRVVIGSWYGEKRQPLDLGGKFHRSRISLVASQVSTIAPGLSGRWDKARRFEVAWDALRATPPQKWITHELPLSEAAEAYRILDQSPEQAIQVVLTY